MKFTDGNWLLRQGVPSAEHEAALHNVLSRLTRRSLDSTPAWLAWYAAEGRQQYPAPDWTAWREEVLRTED